MAPDRSKFLNEQMVLVVFLILFAAVICATAFFQLGLGTVAKPEAGLFPFIVSLGALGLGLSTLLYDCLLRQDKPSAEGYQDHRQGWFRVAQVAAATAAWPLLVKIVGYAPVTFVAAAWISRVLGEEWRRSLLLGLAITFFAYIIFGLIFDTDLALFLGHD
jgi:hypothetical protein